MNDNPYKQSINDLSEPIPKLQLGNSRNHRSISIIAWILIIDGIWRAIRLREHDGLSDTPIDAVVLSFAIFGCYAVSGWGLLGMRKWAVPLYFTVHSLTLLRYVQAYQEGFVTDHSVFLIRVLWDVLVPIAIIATVLPRWNQMRW